MDEKTPLILTDGRSFPCDYAVTNPIMGFLFLALRTTDLLAVVSAFADPALFTEIRHGADVFAGYTVFVNVTREAADQYKVFLRRPYENEVI